MCVHALSSAPNTARTTAPGAGSGADEPDVDARAVTAMPHVAERSVRRAPTVTIRGARGATRGDVGHHTRVAVRQECDVSIS